MECSEKVQPVPIQEQKGHHVISQKQIRKTKAEIAAELLETAIINCELEPGSVMVEADLVDMLDLGRTPVREALVKLSSENLVRLGRGGVVIPELNAFTMLKLLELREPIERVCIQKAIQRQDAGDRQEFQRILDQLAPLRVDDRQGFMELLRHVHLALAAASKNDFILSSLKTTQGLSRRFWCYFASEDDQRYCIDLYCILLKGLIDQDETAAIGQSERLMTYLREFTRKQLDETAWEVG